MKRSIQISEQVHEVAKALVQQTGMKLYRLIEQAILDYQARLAAEPPRPAPKRKAG